MDSAKYYRVTSTHDSYIKFYIKLKNHNIESYINNAYRYRLIYTEITEQEYYHERD